VVRKRMWWIPAGVLLAALGGCSDGGGDNLAGNGGTGAIDITVGTGVRPTYTWSGEPAFSVSVVRTADPSTLVWSVVTPGLDGIASPVTHGTVPSGAIQNAYSETTLTAGVEYRVSVTRISGSEYGHVDFTP